VPDLPQGFERTYFQHRHRTRTEDSNKKHMHSPGSLSTGHSSRRGNSARVRCSARLTAGRLSNSRDAAAGMLFSSAIAANLIRRFKSNRSSEEENPVQQVSGLHNKRVVILGGWSGIGLAVAEQAVSQGATVVIASSNAERVQKAIESLGGHTMLPRTSLTPSSAAQIKLYLRCRHCRAPSSSLIQPDANGYGR